MARQFKRTHHPGQRRQVLLPSLGFPQGKENEGFHAAKRIALDIDAFAFPSLKAVGGSTWAPCCAGDMIETSRGVKCSSLLTRQTALPCFCCRTEVTGGRCLCRCLKNSPSPQKHSLKMVFVITTGAKLAVSITP